MTLWWEHSAAGCCSCTHVRTERVALPSLAVCTCVCVCVLGEGVFVCAHVVLCAVMGYRFRLNLTKDAQDNEKRNIRRYHAIIRGNSIHCNLLTRLTTIEMKNERVHSFKGMGGREVVHVYILQTIHSV